MTRGVIINSSPEFGFLVVLTPDRATSHASMTTIYPVTPLRYGIYSLHVELNCKKYLNPDNQLPVYMHESYKNAVVQEVV